jgi:hypothetical protein
MVILTASRGGGQQPIEVGLLETNDADAFDLAKLTLASGQGGWRNFDGAVRRALAARKSFKDPSCLFPATASEFGDKDV